MRDISPYVPDLGFGYGTINVVESSHEITRKMKHWQNTKDEDGRVASDDKNEEDDDGEDEEKDLDEDEDEEDDEEDSGDRDTDSDEN